MRKTFLLTLFCIIFIAFSFTNSFTQSPQNISNNSNKIEFEKDINKYVWDLSELYPNDTAWEKDKTAIENEIKRIHSFKETMTRSAKDLADALDAIHKLRSRGARMYIYGALRRNINTKDLDAGQKYETGLKLEAEIEGAIVFLRSRIKAIGRVRFQKWLSQEPRLQRHARRVNRIFFELEYSASDDVQKVLEEMGASFSRNTSDFYNSLISSDLGWQTIQNKDGKSIKVNDSNFFGLMLSDSTQQRNSAGRAYFGRLSHWQNVFGLLYSRRIAHSLDLAKKRNFNDGIDALWYLRDGMPLGSYKTTIASARKNKATLQRFVRLKKKLLKLDKFYYPDVYAPMTSFQKEFNIDESMNVAVKAFEPMGEDYQKILLDRLNRKWIHLARTENKRGMYGVYPAISGSYASYTIMSFWGNNPSSGRIAGTAALTVAFTSMPKNRFPETRDDPGIYANAMGYVGRILHDEYMIRNAKSKQERLYFTLHNLNLIWNHFFHNAIYLALDDQIQELIKKGETVDGERISKLHLALLREFYGNKDITIEEVYATDWIQNRIGFWTYEGQLWSPAIAVGSLLAEGIQNGDENAKKAMWKVLGRSEMDLTWHLFKEVGIDVSKEKTYEALYRRMNKMMDQAEKDLEE